MVVNYRVLSKYTTPNSIKYYNFKYLNKWGPVLVIWNWFSCIFLFGISQNNWFLINYLVNLTRLKEDLIFFFFNEEYLKLYICIYIYRSHCIYLWGHVPAWCYCDREKGRRFIFCSLEKKVLFNIFIRFKCNITNVRRRISDFRWRLTVIIITNVYGTSSTTTSTSYSEIK